MSGSLIDLSVLRTLFKGDSEQVQQWVELYLEQTPEQFKLLRHYQATGNAEALANVVHDLRPQAHYLGATQFLDRAMELDDLVKRDGTSSCQPLVEELLQLGHRIELELHLFLRRT